MYRFFLSPLFSNFEHCLALWLGVFGVCPLLCYRLWLLLRMNPPCSALVSRRLNKRVVWGQCSKTPSSDSNPELPLCAAHLKRYQSDPKKLPLISNAVSTDGEVSDEAADSQKPAAAATKGTESGAVAAASVASTAADELSMLKAMMISNAQTTQSLLAQAQATQVYLETLKPSLQLGRGGAAGAGGARRRSSRGKKHADFLDTDSAFSSSGEDSDTLAQQALEQSLRLSGVGAPTLTPPPTASGPTASAASGTSLTGGLGGGNARVGDDEHDAAPLYPSRQLSKEDYAKMTTKCILAGLMDMTPRRLQRILRDCERLKFVKSARARHSATDGADLVVNYESLGAGRHVNLRAGRRKYKYYRSKSLMDYINSWSARKQLVAGALKDVHERESARAHMDELERDIRQMCSPAGGRGFKTHNVDLYLVVVEMIWKCTGYLVVTDCPEVWKFTSVLTVAAVEAPAPLAAPSNLAAAPILQWPKLVKGRKCNECGYPGWNDTECPACNSDHPAAHAVLLARSSKRGGK